MRIIYKKLLLLILLLFVVPTFAAENNYCSAPELQKLYEVFKIINQDYVNKVDDSKLVDSAISGMLSSLDPHSGFINKDMNRELDSYAKGEFGGIGVEFIGERGLIKVISPLEDGPAFIAGIKPGDYIVGIDGKSISGMSYSDALMKIRGAAGTKVRLSISRDNSPIPIEIVVKRDIIKIVSVKSHIESGDVAYIRVSSFPENTAKDIIKSYKSLLSSNKALKGLVLDLRNNPGGLLTQAVSVSDIFLKSGDIVSTKGRVEGSNKNYKVSEGGYKILDLPMVVLVNEGSASASEIIAGALQDHHRAVIMGERSFGKGSVQTVIPLDGGSAMGLTTALYYTPKGRLIQAEGIVPDVVVEESVVKEKNVASNIREEDLTGYIPRNASTTITKDKLSIDKRKNNGDIIREVKADYQLERAVDLVKAISIYKKMK
jgi:carboxyl-terminal processing protease